MGGNGLLPITLGHSMGQRAGHCRAEAWPHGMISHSRQARAALPTPPFFLARPSAATGVPRPDRGRWQAGAQAAGRHFNRVAPPFVGSIAFISAHPTADGIMQC